VFGCVVIPVKPDGGADLTGQPAQFFGGEYTGLNLVYTKRTDHELWMKQRALLNARGAKFPEKIPDEFELWEAREAK
jgi:hypothetical protein